MILLGVLLLVLGFVFAIHLLVVLGVVALVVGAVLAIVHASGRGRLWY